MDAWELRERLLAEGDKTRFLGWFSCGDGIAAADGERAFAGPRTRPPPSVLRDILAGDYERMRDGSPRGAKEKERNKKEQ